MAANRLIVGSDPAADGPTNMGKDREMLARAEEGIAGSRVYCWSGPWVSLGMWQTPERALADTGLVPWVIRPTGGKAVLHGHDATIAMAIPLTTFADDAALTSRSVRVVYRALCKPLVRALNDCGLPASLAEDTPFVRKAGSSSSDCFAHVSPNDIVDPSTGVKVCGCALRLTAAAVLLQASVPHTAPLIEPSALFERSVHFSHFDWSPVGLAASLERQLNNSFASQCVGRQS